MSHEHFWSANEGTQECLGCGATRASHPTVPTTKGAPRELTGDDDSVAHSWNTEPVPVIIDVDRGIAPLIRAFNKVPGVRTHASCEGHPHSKLETNGVPNAWAYVMLYLPPECIIPLAEAIEATIERSATPRAAPDAAEQVWKMGNALADKAPHLEKEIGELCVAATAPIDHNGNCMHPEPCPHHPRVHPAPPSPASGDRGMEERAREFTDWSWAWSYPLNEEYRNGVYSIVTAFAQREVAVARVEEGRLTLEELELFFEDRAKNMTTLQPDYAVKYASLRYVISIIEERKAVAIRKLEEGR